MFLWGGGAVKTRLTAQSTALCSRGQHPSARELEASEPETVKIILQSCGARVDGTEII